ncbi:hypothetical protein GXW83_32700 [Streptacidiphilus sp. PB12-B1b]|uniref:hypothetical protein n=1 Tax=Streptacidiphilus sp. PB12-B1b TaxID=2705012 RepID=UPI0015F84791|nr:hypothetical protein [Streptacidiphilus sp. PB12-B1b]QMU79753.1 hypothetical protein GXW83_32700 [Streptacidiphilus sp. PB12-B1b]
MMYNFFLMGSLATDRVRATLALAFAVAPDDVDVSDADDYENRNWDAAVGCTYEQAYGDVTWALEVTTADDPPEPLSEVGLAAALAEGLGQVVICPAQSFPPSAYWLTAPGGLRTRARLYESDQEDAGYTIDAVGQQVPGFPDLRVEQQPEVIRECRVPTPVTTAFSKWLGDRQGAATEASPSGAADPEWYARTRLGAWEALVVRMKSNWPPDGWYPADYYQQDLETRDALDALLPGLDPQVAGALTIALAQVDDDFRTGTADDEGAALSDALALPRLELALRGWWWQRCPDPLPWDGTAGH